MRTETEQRNITQERETKQRPRLRTVARSEVPRGSRGEGKNSEKSGGKHQILGGRKRI